MYNTRYLAGNIRYEWVEGNMEDAQVRVTFGKLESSAEASPVRE